MPELREEYLARHRVDDGTGGYRALQMSREDRNFRRSYIRSVLKLSPRFRNLSNEQLDKSRLFRMGDSIIFEDAEMYQHAIGERTCKQKSNGTSSRYD